MSHYVNTPMWDAAWSAAAALTEVVFPGQLLFYGKNHVQLKRQNPELRLPRNPAAWYRGFTSNAAGIVPATVMQMTVARAAANRFFGKTEDLTIGQKVQCAALSGVVVSFYQGPAELISMRQKAWETSATQAIRRVISEYGASTLWRGTESMIPREIKFTVMYQAAGPYARSTLEEKFGFSPATASLLGYGGAGLVGGVISHPWDTLKTIRQNDLDLRTRRTFFQTFTQVLKSGSMDGVGWRSARFGGAICIYDFIGTRMKNRVAEEL